MILLYYIALILFAVFGVVNFIYLWISKRKYPRGYWRQTAVNIDKFGNREFRFLWNNTLIKKNEMSVQFGDEMEDETISEVLGYNYRNNTLSLMGKFVVFLLTPNHCLKAIGKRPIQEEPLTIVLRVATWITIVLTLIYIGYEITN